MSAAKHTPGPWFVDGVRFVRQEPSPRHVICRLPTTRNEGDARLIAAAPELLEMAECLQAVCARVIEQYGPVQCGVDFAALGGSVNRVIAKATGSAA